MPGQIRSNGSEKTLHEASCDKICRWQKRFRFNDILTDTVVTLGDDAPVLSKVQKWAAGYRKVES